MQDEVLLVNGNGSRFVVQPQVRIVFVGDTRPVGGVTTIASAIGRLVSEIDPLLTVFLGDMVNGTATFATEFAAYFPAGWQLAVPGNHDVVDSSLATYLAAYPSLPTDVGSGRYWQHGVGPVRLFGINSTETTDTDITVTGAQAVWLQAQAAAAAEPWLFALMHHPPYSNGTHGGTSALRWGRTSGLPFENIDIVMSGHDHVYERLSVGGGHYIVNGAASNSLYTFGGTTNSIAQVAQYGIVLCEASWGRMRLQFITLEGLIKDELVIQR